ncbi:MAG: hypothetical protein AAB870_02470 [Patescibacteria group bacterium]
MRQVLSLSLDPTVLAETKLLSKKRGYTSLSAYIQYLISLDKNLISEEALLKKAKKARADYAKGDVMKINSLADLL